MQLVLLPRYLFISTFLLEPFGLILAFLDRGKAGLRWGILVDLRCQVLELVLVVFERALVLQLRVQCLDLGQRARYLFVRLRDQAPIVGLVLLDDVKHELLLLHAHLFLLNLVQDRLNLILKLLLRALIETFGELGVLHVHVLVCILDDQEAHYLLNLLLVHHIFSLIIKLI